VAVFTNVFLGMQIPLSSYLQVCFSITNDVVMSISLMYEKAEAGTTLAIVSVHYDNLNILLILDLMLRKPRNARTDRLTNWQFFFHIYLVCSLSGPYPSLVSNLASQFFGLMIWPCAMAMWFLYMSRQGFRFREVILVYAQWTDGYKGYTANELAHFVSVGQCI
jgi:sodium/potassium-transporting ATPase subunit alpha